MYNIEHRNCGLREAIAKVPRRGGLAQTRRRSAVTATSKRPAASPDAAAATPKVFVVDTHHACDPNPPHTDQA